MAGTMFTTRHYTAVAEILKECYRAVDRIDGGPQYRAGCCHCAVALVQVKLSALFFADNPRFNAAKFKEACSL